MSKGFRVVALAGKVREKRPWRKFQRLPRDDRRVHWGPLLEAYKMTLFGPIFGPNASFGGWTTRLAIGPNA